MNEHYMPLETLINQQDQANMIFAFQVFVYDDGNVNSEYWWTLGFHHIVDACPQLHQEITSIKNAINSSVEDAWQECREKFIEEIDSLLKN